MRSSLDAVADKRLVNGFGGEIYGYVTIVQLQGKNHPRTDANGILKFHEKTWEKQSFLSNSLAHGPKSTSFETDCMKIGF